LIGTGDLEATEAAGGDEWEDLIFDIHGFNRSGVEWMVTGGDVGIIYDWDMQNMFPSFLRISR
jgi:hypothetical protein